MCVSLALQLLGLAPSAEHFRLVLGAGLASVGLGASSCWEGEGVVEATGVRVAEGRGRAGRAGSRVPDDGGPWPSSSSWRPLFWFWSLARVVWFFRWSEMVWSRAFEDVVEGKKAEGGGWARSRMAGECGLHGEQSPRGVREPTLLARLCPC